MLWMSDSLGKRKCQLRGLWRRSYFNKPTNQISYILFDYLQILKYLWLLVRLKYYIQSI